MLKVIPLFEEVSDIEDNVVEKVTSDDIVRDFIKHPVYKEFSKKLNDAASFLDTKLNDFCNGQYGNDLDDEEFIDAKSDLINRVVKQYV